MDKLFDIIIVNYNSTHHCAKNIALLLKSKLNQSLNILIQDNHSKDQAISLKTFFPNINLTLNPKNLGFGAAINQALLKSKAPYIVLINPDAFIEIDFFEKVLAYLDLNPVVGILGPKVLDYDGAVQGSARSFPNPLTSLFGRNSFLTRMFPKNAISRANVLTLDGTNHDSMEVDWVSGACMVIRREALAKAGNFDERFFMYWEDADICRRMWQTGWKVVYYPEAVIHHQVGQSSQTKPYSTILYFHKSCFKLYVKYLNWHSILLIPLVLSALTLRGGLVAVLTVFRRHFNLN